MSRFEAAGLTEQCVVTTGREATPAELLRGHTQVEGGGGG